MVNKNWTPAKSARRPDMIISSKARAKGELYGFTPSYSNDPDNIFLLLADEYRRQWFEELKTNVSRAAYKKMLLKTGRKDEIDKSGPASDDKQQAPKGPRRKFILIFFNCVFAFAMRASMVIL